MKMALSSYWADEYVEKKRNATEAMNLIHSGQRIFIGSYCGEPQFLVKALAGSKIEGIEPLATVVQDFVAPVSSKPKLRMTLTNILNRPVKGTLSVEVEGLVLDKPKQNVSFKAHETKKVALEVAEGKASSTNTYPMTLTFDAGTDGMAMHEENIHATT